MSKGKIAFITMLLLTGVALLAIRVVAIAADPAASQTKSVTVPEPSTSFAVDYGLVNRGDVLELNVNPKPYDCKLTGNVIAGNWKGSAPKFTVIVPSDFIGEHTGKFEGTYSCADGPGKPPTWEGTATFHAEGTISVKVDPPVACVGDEVNVIAIVDPAVPSDVKVKVKFTVDGEPISPSGSGVSGAHSNSEIAGGQNSTSITVKINKAGNYSFKAEQDGAAGSSGTGSVKYNPKDQPAIASGINLDLVVQGKAEDKSSKAPHETDPGAFVLLNTDDDDFNNQPDNTEIRKIIKNPLIDWSNDENDLVLIETKHENLEAGEKLTLAAPKGAGTIRVWTEKTKGDHSKLVTLPYTETVAKFPKELWLEGINRSSEYQGTSLSLTYSKGACPDLVNITVIDLNILRVTPGQRNDITHQTHDGVVGHKINVVRDYLPELPKRIQNRYVKNGLWAVTHKHLEDFKVTNSSGKPIELKQGTLKLDQIKFHWVGLDMPINPSQRPQPDPMRRLTYKLEFDGVPFEVFTRFNNAEPGATPVASMPSTVDIRNIFDQTGIQQAGIRLSVGDTFEMPGNNGLVQGQNRWVGIILRGDELQQPENAEGEFRWAQVATPYRARVTPKGRTVVLANTPGLDNDFPAPTDFSDVLPAANNNGPRARLWDSPNQQLTSINKRLASSVIASDRFETWLIFRPIRLNGEDIPENQAEWVPLFKYGWGWQGRAERDKGDATVWSVANDEPEPMEIAPVPILLRPLPAKAMYPDWDRVLRARN